MSNLLPFHMPFSTGKGNPLVYRRKKMTLVIYETPIYEIPNLLNIPTA